ncbi:MULTISPECIES: phosphatidate cytidylyltransferase [Stappiaceae]|jgi:phosphatidate cytidylyltransferase|uniref:phosphatidate cytidylyltransferase n=1 Tax=Stappiaceae TaxID=2821832 RepID=UPI00126933FA|nr:MULTISPECIES: phosphatidate cytidylyltransferase [Stappiaceae]QFS99695.1 Phosphatidate cytidylyltransferase [Labrenzia sp. THAF191b]QFT06009.1 Phosphatidate cytidylyltransferase [Labrenzia sp. THAF191a]QFT17553.1 Phosphatidate cytidylyltransferase [Labrenzia sp. THAF187b]UES40243.1 phosphatidate cytidylyltransferase [Roseibium aggregatum]UES44597.1 phosphatidate cytidylyltransferase [Roseibium aggregatum]
MAEPDQNPKKLSDLRLRFISALVLGPLVLLITYLGNLPFAALTLVASGLFLWEWFTITGTQAKSPSSLTGFATLFAIGVLTVAGHPDLGLGAMVAGALIAYALGGFSKAGRWAIEGILYSGLALFSLLVLREGSNGLLVAFFLLFVVWATDIFAYFTGRALGGPKLWPRVSPKKTWSGAIGGLVLATVFGAGVAFVANAQDLMLWALLAAGLSVVSQAGDLLESAIKRRFDVKDSSKLIPGHGGIMDRIDGLVAAAIFAVLIGLVAGGSLADPIAGLGLI